MSCVSRRVQRVPGPQNAAAWVRAERPSLHAEDDLLASRLAASAFWLACDKGTFDAVGLRADASVARAGYAAAVARLLAPGGLLVVTSCNCTREELVEELAGAAGGGTLETVDWVKTYPVFRFGGVEGQKVCTVAFRRTTAAAPSPPAVSGDRD